MLNLSLNLYISKQKTKLLFSNQVMDAEEAKDCKIVTQVLKKGKADQRVLIECEKLATKSSLVRNGIFFLKEFYKTNMMSETKLNEFIVTDFGNIPTDSAAKYACEIERFIENRAKAIIAAMDEIRFCWQIKSPTVTVHHRIQPTHFGITSTEIIHIAFLIKAKH